MKILIDPILYYLKSLAYNPKRLNIKEALYEIKGDVKLLIKGANK